MDEVCQIFEITPPTIYDWIKHGKLKPKKSAFQGIFLWNDNSGVVAGKTKISKVDNGCKL